MQLYQGDAIVKDLKGVSLMVPDHTFNLFGNVQPIVVYAWLQSNTGNGAVERFDTLYHHVVYLPYLPSLYRSSTLSLLLCRPVKDSLVLTRC